MFQYIKRKSFNRKDLEAKKIKQMAKAEKHAAIIEYYTEQGFEICRWKNGYWLRKNDQKHFVTAAKAAKTAGITATNRTSKVLLPWGDYAIIAAMNRRSKKL
jgi:hypothetical protein